MAAATDSNREPEPQAKPHTERAVDRRGDLARRLFSLSGVVPLGAFLFFHLWLTSSLGGSREVYDRQVGFLHGGAVLGLLEVVLVIVPLLYHAGYGVMRSLRPRDPDHAYVTDVMYTLERASGVVVLVFIAVHVWEFRVQTWTHGMAVPSYSTKLVEHLSSTQSGVPLIALGYLAGIGATVFHLANGMTSFCTTWGFAPTFTARRWQRIFFRVLGIALFAWSAALVVQLATGTRIFPLEQPRTAPSACGSDAVSPAAPPHAHAPSAGSAARAASTPSAPTSARPIPSGGLPGGDR